MRQLKNPAPWENFREKNHLPPGVEVLNILSQGGVEVFEISSQRGLEVFEISSQGGVESKTFLGKKGYFYNSVEGYRTSTSNSFFRGDRFRKSFLDGVSL